MGLTFLWYMLPVPYWNAEKEDNIGTANLGKEEAQPKGGIAENEKPQISGKP